MHAVILSFFVILASEMGDKTQLVALCLAARFQRPMPVTLGILAATLASNFIAASVGQSMSMLLHGWVLHGLLGISFLAAAAWALIPDEVESCPTVPNHGIFVATFISFFFAEIGDKTQLATAALAAQLGDFFAVVMGTTLGMMAANIPAVLMGHKMLEKVLLPTIRATSGAVFAVLGTYELSRVF